MRALAESRMLSTAAVMRQTGTTKDADGFTVPEWATVYIGPFRLGGANAGSSGYRTVTVGAQEMQLAIRVGHFPADTAGLTDGDLIEVTAWENAGLVLRIVEASSADQQTALRLPVVETQRPEEWA
jgi:hypothetical protein